MATLKVYQFQHHSHQTARGRRLSTISQRATNNPPRYSTHKWIKEKMKTEMHKKENQKDQK